MITRFKKLPACLALWISSCCFALCALTEGKPDNFQSSRLSVVEKRLQAYLNKRVLVFRKGEIERHQLSFDSRGRPLAENGAELKFKANAILFVGLALDAERLVISGEGIRSVLCKVFLTKAELGAFYPLED